MSQNYDILETGADEQLTLSRTLSLSLSPPPIPFILIYCDQTSEINNIIKFYYSNIVERTYPRSKAQLVCAIKKNKSLKDLLVHTALDQ